MRTRAVSSSPRAHSILLTCRGTSSVREARKPLRDNNHGQTASHLCQEFWSRDFSAVRAIRTTEAGCQPGETLASAGRGVFVLSTTAYLSTQGELHLGGQRRSLTGCSCLLYTSDAADEEDSVD